ncbi:MAG: helix-turn-helix domain-containing protein [Crocosphaera sp.]|nr:helix-turn-helix domain-containing protein [Crocosphaera sp.]
MVTISIQSLPMKLSFAQWFRLRREIAGLTQAQVAQALGVRPQTISNWEKSVSVPSLNPEQTLMLCSLLGLSLEDLAKGFKGEVTMT